MGVKPSEGVFKKMFDPGNMKKKTKAALGTAPSGGHNIKKEKPSIFGRKTHAV